MTMSALIRIAARRRRADARLKPQVWLADGWNFTLSFDERGYHLGAQLVPFGRRAVDEDWRNLGRWNEALRVPPGQREEGHTMQTAPNAEHKWVWLEKATRPS